MMFLLIAILPSTLHHLLQNTKKHCDKWEHYPFLPRAFQKSCVNIKTLFCSVIKHFEAPQRSVEIEI